MTTRSAAHAVAESLLVHNRDSQSTAALFRRLTHELGRLCGREVALARAELAHAVASALAGATTAAAGGAALFAGLLMLLAAAVLALSLVITAWLAALLVGTVQLVGDGAVSQRCARLAYQLARAIALRPLAGKGQERPDAEDAMSTTTEVLEREAGVARDEVDLTLHALGDRLSVKRRIATAADALLAAASRVSLGLCPEITTVIRLDHTYVLSAFRRYRRHLSAVRKRALVANVCLALDVHAQLEEEIFYPALFAIGSSTEDLDRSITEHDEIRAVIQTLREMPTRDSRYDAAFYRLIRLVLHHVADEETHYCRSLKGNYLSI